MDLASDIVDVALLPTAAFLDSRTPASASGLKVEKTSATWSESKLNPKNRIDSLDPVRNPRWRIDGGAGLGTQFYTVPLFMRSLVPLRIDTFIPEAKEYLPELREVLESAATFHVKDHRIVNLKIVCHVLRTLEYWSGTVPNFEELYHSLPFGSRIVFENIERNVKDIRVRVMPNHNFERELLSIEALQAMWNLQPSSWPPSLDISQLTLLRQPFDSVGIVRIEKDPTRESQIFAFKSLTSYAKYLYHELKILLTMPVHSNILKRPCHIITKKCGFGGKTAVVGFTTAFLGQDGPRDILPLRRLQDTLEFDTQLKWATQVTSAMLCIRSAGNFYCDLRLDNIVLTKNDDLVMVDFEQRGVWAGFSAPEVNYLSYIDNLAKSTAPLPPVIKSKYAALYKKYIADHVPAGNTGPKYQNPERGYCVPWLCLNDREQEAAEVYMLGRVLWCIFEAVSAPETGVWVSYVREGGLEFPEFDRTPPVLRELISNCTKIGDWGLEWNKRFGVVRKGSKLVLRRTGEGSEEEVLTEAKKSWCAELAAAEAFLEQRDEAEFLDSGRPRMVEVLRRLEVIHKDMR